MDALEQGYDISDRPHLSIVTTMYRSAAYIEEFHQRVTDAARRITERFEIVLVDDGSPDTSLDVAVRIAERDPHVRVVELSRNFGHHKAMMTGLEYAAGDHVFLVDVDLEEPPELLEEFYARLAGEGWDVIYGYQQSRKGGFFERYAGRVGWLLIERLYSVHIPMNQCTVRLMRRDYVLSLLRHRESNTVIGGLWVITGYKQHGVAIQKSGRRETSYSLAHRARTLLNGITSFSTVPLRAMSLFGFVVSALSFAAGVFVIFERLIYGAAVGWASLIVSIWFLGGAIILCVGVLGEYVSRVFIETKNRPYTIVRRVYGPSHD